MIRETPFIPDAIIFDMDGLMLDTERPMINIWRDAARKLGWELSLDIGYKTIGLTEEATKALLMKEYGKDFPYQKIRAEWEKIFVKKIEEEGVNHQFGLLDLLDHLDKLNIPFAVATSTIKKAALWKLEKANILRRFSTMVFGDEVNNGKPAPDIFLLAAERLGKKPETCIGFEDSPAGLKGLYNAKIPSIFIKDLIDPPEEILNTVWKHLNNLKEAIPLFG